jgi:hypothetical protein
METSASLPSSVLSPAEIERLRPALAAHYLSVKGVLGAQLGAFVRRYLDNPDLKGRFGGLREFVARHFPTEIVWSGRQGLDDLYDIAFSAQGAALGNNAWEQVSREPSAALWPAATNPSIYRQFAWSSKENALFQASLGVALGEGLSAVEKLKTDDYRSIATRFVDSLEGIDTGFRTHALETTSSLAVFTGLMREKGLLPRWEAFRISSALHEFGNRLGAAGAESSAVKDWTDILRLSQHKARLLRSKKIVSVSEPEPKQTLTLHESIPIRLPDSRAVAIKAVEFLSDSDLGNLSLPLGIVMRALVSLVGPT